MESNEYPAAEKASTSESLEHAIVPVLGTARKSLTDTEAVASSLQGTGKMYVTFSQLSEADTSGDSLMYETRCFCNIYSHCGGAAFETVSEAHGMQ